MFQEFNFGNTGPFKKLPSGQNISFAFREGFRGGIYKGVHIENVGVKVDRLAPPSMSDLFNATNDQLLILQKFLKDESPKYTSSIYLDNEERLDFVQNSHASFKASWNDTDSLEFKMDNKTLETREIDKNGENLNIIFPEKIQTNKISEERLEVLGSNENKRGWRKIINYRVIPTSKIIAPNNIFNVNLASEGDVSIYSHNTLKKDGWNISDNSLYLGNGTYYSDLAHTEASLFLTLPPSNYELSFDATIKTEPTDTLKVIAVYQGKEITLLDKIGGDVPLNHYTADLSKFAGKSIEIRYVFESDPAKTDKGITITKITIHPTSP